MGSTHETRRASPGPSDRIRSSDLPLRLTSTNVEVAGLAVAYRLNTSHVGGTIMSSIDQNVTDQDVTAQNVTEHSVTAPKQRGRVQIVIGTVVADVVVNVL